MCGRFVGFRRIEELKAYFPIDRVEGSLAASYNIAPSQPVLAITRQRDENVLEPLYWGLVPFWAKDKTIGSRLINARSETVAQKPSFREAFKKRRCLIPADGFFEWMKGKNKKQPIYITLPKKIPFAFAGLYENWHDPKSAGRLHRSCSIITRPAGESMKAVHQRMPVILNPNAYQIWLDPQNHDVVGLQTLVEEQALTEVVCNPVSPVVNSPGHNDPSNIRPIQMELDF